MVSEGGKVAGWIAAVQAAAASGAAVGVAALNAPWIMSLSSRKPPFFSSLYSLADRPVEMSGEQREKY